MDPVTRMLRKIVVVSLAALALLAVTCGPSNRAEATTNFQQYFPSIKSIQTGTISGSSGTSPTATITSVNTAKTFIIPTGALSSNGTLITYNLVLTNATTVTCGLAFTGGSATVGFMVVEFNQ